MKDRPNRAQRRLAAAARRRIPCTGPRSPFRDRSDEIATTQAPRPAGLERVLENGTYLVQDCARPGGWRVLMICRRDGRGGITWDDLHWIKEILYPTREAVELYPREEDLVDVANMRHLWVLPPFAWMPHGLDRNPGRGGVG